MKLMMIETLGDGGIAHYTFNLLTALAKKEILAYLFTAANYEFLGRNHRYKVYPLMFLITNRVIRFFPYLSNEKPIPALLRRLIKLAEYPFNTLEAIFIAKRQKIKYIHLQSVNWIELLMIAVFKLAGVKIIYTIHNVNPHHKKLRTYHKLLYRIMYSLCDRLIIHSESGKEEIIELFRIKREKIFVIPHGDYKFFVPERILRKDQAKVALGISRNCKTILFFGAIRPNKGLENILRALPHIKRESACIKLLVVGEPWENYKRYKTIIENENIQNEVFEKLEYIPNQEIALYFTAADVVVLPYNEITQSGILQVAYAFAKPVVATAIGGLNEAVKNGKNGYLVPPNDIKALAEKTVEILSNKEKRENMGKYSRYLSDTKYSWDSIAKQTLDVYSRL